MEQRFWRSDIALEEAIDRIIIHVSDEEETDTVSEVAEMIHTYIYTYICCDEDSTDMASETDKTM
jgi:hypothetical protein